MLIKKFKTIGIRDIPSVGGKNASLGEMYNQLVSKGIHIPNGFATTSSAFWKFLKENRIQQPLENIMSGLDKNEYTNLGMIGERARSLILNGQFSETFTAAIEKAYRDLDAETAVAVRSSATAEDLPDASFAGQHDTFLNVKGRDAVLEAVKKCFASLYTDRAIKYREDKGFKHADVALSVGVQLMVRADQGCSGVGFTIEPESGFENAILLSGVWGLGENIVQGTVNPDEFYVFKPNLKNGKYPILQKKRGDKKLTMVYGSEKDTSPVINIDTPVEKQERYVLSDEEVITMAQWALLIEEHYQKPMDIEWAKDGITEKLFIIQARPETVHHTKNKKVHIEYRLTETRPVLVDGNAVGSKIKVGNAVLDNLKVMVPFFRTVSEGEKVLSAMEEYGLKRGENGLEVYTMVEIPSNVILAEEFAKIFDGFSIGSNDLTQLTLGIDRDSEIMGELFDENDQAAKRMISMAIESAKRTKTKIGFCGQVPSDFPEFAKFLVKEGIDSISFNPDALLQGIENINKAEESLITFGNAVSGN
jgi:phosphoenolpyruvate synthase/pyruvate phosphate dikinase